MEHILLVSALVLGTMGMSWPFIRYIKTQKRIRIMRHLSSPMAYLLIGLLFLVNNSFAQKIKNVIGPSPQAAAFAKYGDIPVSIYTGVPNIAIPLYTVQNNDITIPINLSYHASGFRVDEEAGRAGLGWVVNAGGVISRSVNGGDDFLPVRGYLNNTMPEFFDSEVTTILAQGTNLVGNSSSNSNTYVSNIVGHQVDMTPFLPVPNDPDEEVYDLEPDVFTYNFNGISGKFTIKKNKEIVKQSPDAIDIKLLNNDGTSWQITTTDGIKYIFDKTEKCKFQSVFGSYTNYITAWYLTKVISPKGAEVTFTYTEIFSNVISYNNLNEKYVLEVIPIGTPNSSLMPIAGTKTSSYPPVKSYNPIMLTSINFPNGSITFDYQDRIDLPEDKRLSKININNIINAEASFHYDLVQDYFNATFTSYTMPDPGGLDQNIFNKRLKLASLVKRNWAGDTEQVHQFSYNEQDLPSKKSYARDDWGFYNGAHNSTLLPNTLYASHIMPGLTVSYPSGADRKASAEHCGAYILKEIRYPTGGRTVFDFESNDYDAGNSVNGSPSAPQGQITETTKHFITRRGFDETFQITFPTILTGSSIKFNITSQSGQAISYPYPLPEDAYFEIYAASNLSTPVVYFMLGYESFWVDQGNYYYKRDDQFSLPAGDYVIKTHIASNVLFLNYINFSFSYKHYEYVMSNPHQIVTGGGVRIAKITNFDHLDNVVSIKNFDYHYNFDYDGDGIAEECSYGRRLASTSYASWEWVEMCGTDAFDNSVILNSRAYNLYSQSGIPNNEVIVGYDKVTVWNGISKANGYTEYDYHNTISIETPYTDSGFDYRPVGIANLVSLDNGSLLKQTDYVFTNNTFRKLKEVINEYSPTPVMTQVGLRMVPTTFSGGCYRTAGAGLLFALYPAFQSSWNRLSSQTINSYSNGTDFTSVKTDYEYEADSPKHYLPRITTTTNSEGKKKSTVSIYPTDYANGNTAIDQMKAANIIEPIEQVTCIKDGVNMHIVSGTISLFETGGKGLLDKQYAIENTTPVPQNAFKFSNQSTGIMPFAGVPGVISMDPAYKLKVSYDEYDNFGNLLSATPAGGTPVNYIYSYKNQYPVAEAKNTVQKDIAYSSFEADGKGNWTYSGASAVDSTAPTGRKVYNLGGGSISRGGLTTSTKYLLNYWAKSPSATGISGGTAIAIGSLNGWTHYQRILTGSTSVTLSGSVYVDEVRLHPLTASMTTYTYDPLVGMTSSTDAAGRTTYYKYEGFGRLQTVKDMQQQPVSDYQYHYRNQ